MRSKWITASVLLVGMTTFCQAKEVKIHGFVTSIKSPTSFEIDEYAITSDANLVFDIEKDNSSDTTFKPQDIRIGTELEIKGDFDVRTGSLKASSIKVFLEDTRKIKRTALLEKPPLLEKDGDNWKGLIFVDGQKVNIDKTTAVTFKATRTEKKEAKKEGDKPAEEAGKLTSPDQLNLDTFARYEGTRQADGSILATKIEFQHAELADGEAKLWKQLTPHVKEANYVSSKSGQLDISKMKYKLFPNKEAQDYIEKLGNSLIPAHQKELPDGSVLKIPFKFYLIEDKSFNASAYPNGVVVVHTGVFSVSENEAQLAFVLCHEISHSIEKHVWREQEYHKGAFTALRIGGLIASHYVGSSIIDTTHLIESGFRNGYSRSLENQADRVGMEWMLNAGYDIREAPQAWKAVSKKYGDEATNIFWDNHDNNTTRRSYLMAEIRNNYPDLDYSKLKKDSDDFHRIAAIVNEGTQKKKKK